MYYEGVLTSVDSILTLQISHSLSEYIQHFKHALSFLSHLPLFPTPQILKLPLPTPYFTIPLPCLILPRSPPLPSQSCTLAVPALIVSPPSQSFPLKVTFTLFPLQASFSPFSKTSHSPFSLNSPISPFNLPPHTPFSKSPPPLHLQSCLLSLPSLFHLIPPPPPIFNFPLLPLITPHCTSSHHHRAFSPPHPALSPSSSAIPHTLNNSPYPLRPSSFPPLHPKPPPLPLP